MLAGNRRQSRCVEQGTQNGHATILAFKADIFRELAQPHFTQLFLCLPKEMYEG